MLAEALGRCIRQARQALEVEIALVFAEALGRCIRQARQAVERENVRPRDTALVLAEALGRRIRQGGIVKCCG